MIFTGTQCESNGTLLLLQIAAKVRDERPAVRFLVSDLFPTSNRGANISITLPFLACRIPYGWFPRCRTRE